MKITAQAFFHAGLESAEREGEDDADLRVSL
jgi:hypothetical protein